MQREDFGDDISVMNSYADNMNYVDSMNKEERYMQKAKAMFDDDGSGNTGIEIIRLNKKFDIFMKRFMRAEEDIKEVKQNFYRVMHCAFAKYEQGFKRKNEYLERRRVKRKEEIDKGVQHELKKRGMAGELDDPLLMSSVGGGGGGGKSESMVGAGLGINPEDSSIGLHNMGKEDSSMSLGKMGHSGGRGMQGAAGGLGIDDSELTNNIVGVGGDGNAFGNGGGALEETGFVNTSSKKPAEKGRKKDKKAKDKKKKKKKDRSDSDSD